MSFRVVHVLAPRTAGDEGVAACAAVLAQSPTPQGVVIVGDARDEARAWAMGVRSVFRLTPLLGRPANSRGALRRILAGMFAADQRSPVVQCWCPATLEAAGVATNLRERRVGVLLRVPGRECVGPDGRLRAFVGDATLACFDSTVAERVARIAAPSDRFFMDRIRLLDPPAMSMTGLGGHRTRIRRELGLCEEDHVVLFLTDPAARGDALRFTFILGLAYAAGHTTVGLMPRGTLHHRRSARFVRLNNRRWGLVESDRPLSHLIAAADVAVSDAGAPDGPVVRSCGSIALEMAAAFGLPTVGPPQCDLERHLGPIGRELTGRSRTNGAVLPSMLRAIEDPAYRRTVSLELLRHAARPRSGHTLENLWREVANAPVLHGEPPTPELLGATA